MSLKVNELGEMVVIAGEDVLRLHVVGRDSLSSVMSRMTQAAAPECLFQSVFLSLDKTPIHVAIVDNMFYYLWRPDVIPLICTVTTGTDGILIPELGPENKENNALMQLDWVPPIPLFYLLRPSYLNNKWYLGELYFFGLHADQVWRPPLPNCFEDGRACHNTNGGPGFATVTELLEWIMEHMKTSIWNSHLRQGATQRWVRFKPKGKTLEQVPTPEYVANPASGDLRVVGNKIISSIAELWNSANATKSS